MGFPFCLPLKGLLSLLLLSELIKRGQRYIGFAVPGDGGKIRVSFLPPLKGKPPPSPFTRILQIDVKKDFEDA